MSRVSQEQAEYCKILKNSFFYRPPPVVASVLDLTLQVSIKEDLLNLSKLKRDLTQETLISLC